MQITVQIVRGKPNKQTMRAETDFSNSTDQMLSDTHSAIKVPSG
jgi:hypothetical protein